MNSPFDLRREGVSGRLQSRFQDRREERELVMRWIGEPRVDYLIHLASQARGDKWFERSAAALEALAPIAARYQEQFAWAKPIVKHLIDASGEAESYGRLWDHFVTAYREHRLPYYARQLTDFKRQIREAVERDRAAGYQRFYESESVWQDCVLDIADNFDPLLDPDALAADLNSVLDDDVYFKPFVVGEREGELTIACHFKRRRAEDEERLAAHRGEALAYSPGLYAVPVATDAKTKDRFEVVYFDDIEENPVKEWLIDDMLGDGEFTCFWGMPGCGKSVILTDAAFHVASGEEWFGKPVKQGLVVYIAAERAKLTERRIAALRKRHNAKGVPLVILKGRLDFTSGLDDAKAIIEKVREVERKTGQACAWLIVDTIARTFGGGDENAAKDMGAYVQACDLIRESINAHLSLVHHCARNGEKPRGSIALDGAVDASFKVGATAAYRVVTTDKENDTVADGPLVRFRLESEELGTDPKTGKITKAPVVVKPDPNTIKVETADGVRLTLSRSKPRKAALVLAQAIEEAGQVSPDGRQAVHEGELRKRLRAASSGPTVKESSLDTIVRRSLRELIEKGDAEKIGEWFYPKQAEQPNAENVEG